MNIPLPSQVTDIGKRFKPLVRHHYFIFLLLLLGGLVWAISAVNQTLIMPTDQTYKDQKTNESLKANFDQATIQKIEALQRSNEDGNNQQSTQPGARTNPFTE